MSSVYYDQKMKEPRMQCNHSCFSKSGRVVKCAVLQHGMVWVWAPAQVMGWSLAQTTAPPILVDMYDGYKYVGQKGLAAMPYTCLYCVHLLVEKAGVAPEVTFGITARKQERVQVIVPL